jgi:hypothetical protein
MESIAQFAVGARELRLGKTGGASEQSRDFGVRHLFDIVQPHHRATDGRQRGESALEVAIEWFSRRVYRLLVQRRHAVGSEPAEAAVPG